MCLNPEQGAKRYGVCIYMNRLLDAEVKGGFSITVVNDEGKKIVIKTNADTRFFYSGKQIESNLEIENHCEVRIITDENGEA